MTGSRCETEVNHVQTLKMYGSKPLPLTKLIGWPISGKHSRLATASSVLVISSTIMVSGHKTRIYSVDLCFPIRVTMQVGFILRRVFTAVISYLSEYKEAFALFDKKGTGAVPRETLGDLLRALGQNPTQAEVADIVASAPREGK
jgi:hypothetical protein